MGLQATVIFCLLVVACHCHIQKRSSGGEELIDEIIYEAVQNIKAKGQQQVEIPNVVEELTKTYGIITVRGTLKLENGWFRDLSTLRRTGEVEMEEGEDSVTLGISMGLGEMEFGYKNYSAEIWHLGIHGELRVHVRENSLHGKATMFFNSTACHTVLDDIEVNKLDGVEVSLSGLGKDGDLVYNLVANYLVNRFNDKIKQAINRRMAGPIREALARKDICQKFPH